MLDVRLDKIAKIGSKKGISYIANWLSNDAIKVNSLIELAKTTNVINSTEVVTILWLLQSMGIVRISENEEVSPITRLNEEVGKGDESFSNWFIESFVGFCLDNDIIDTNAIKYSITDDAYIMDSTAIKPSKYACYRNILIEYNVISFLQDARYRINSILDIAIKTPERTKRISEKQLLAQLEKQREQGERGELFVLDYEMKRITDPDKRALIKRISVIDVGAGFDIVSVNDNNSLSSDRYIEVKTYKGTPHFILSDNEKDKASLIGESYFIYLVDDDRINDEGYIPMIICNPCNSIFESDEWLVEYDSYRITKL